MLFKIKYLKRISIGLIIFSGVIQGCSNHEKETSIGTTQGRMLHTINLFPKENIIYDNTGKLSLDEAFQLSKEVVYAVNIEKIDSSISRGVKPFYVYRATEGRFEKTTNVKKNKLPFLFISEQKLFQGKVSHDSTYLFLEPIQQYGLLRKKMDVKYQWVYAAPFIVHSRKQLQ